MKEPEASWASSAGVRRSMKANRGRDTSIELGIRRLLFARGLRYRVNYRPVPNLRRTADVVFTRRKIAVFIDGCFWHGCPAHYVAPRTNAEYWSSKVDGNIVRDADTTRALQDADWIVLRFWEHEAPDAVVEQIVQVFAERASSQGRAAASSLEAER